MEHPRDSPETFIPAFAPDHAANAEAHETEKPNNPEQPHQQEFAALYTAAMESASPEEQLKLLREFEFRLRTILEPGSSQSISIDDQSLHRRHGTWQRPYSNRRRVTWAKNVISSRIDHSILLVSS